MTSDSSKQRKQLQAASSSFQSNINNTSTILNQKTTSSNHDQPQHPAQSKNSLSLSSMACCVPPSQHPLPLHTPLTTKSIHSPSLPLPIQSSKADPTTDSPCTTLMHSTSSSGGVIAMIPSTIDTVNTSPHPTPNSSSSGDKVKKRSRSQSALALTSSSSSSPYDENCHYKRQALDQSNTCSVKHQSHTNAIVSVVKSKEPMCKDENEEQDVQLLSTEQLHSLIDNVDIPSYGLNRHHRDDDHDIHVDDIDDSNSKNDESKNGENNVVKYAMGLDTIQESKMESKSSSSSISQLGEDETAPMPPQSSSAVSILTSPHESDDVKIALPSTSQQSKKTSSSSSSSSGRWSRSEHEAFLDGLKIYGREWKKVAKKIPTRTSAQIRSHAQKYFAKLARDEQHYQASVWFNSSHVGSNSINCSTDTNSHDIRSLSSTAASLGGVLAGLEIGQSLPPSVLERVDKILKDPEGAQKEVEQTLLKLRERYNQLQQKVREKQARKLAAAATKEGNDGSAYGDDKIDKFLDVKRPVATLRQKVKNGHSEVQSRNPSNTSEMSPMILFPHNKESRSFPNQTTENTDLQSTPDTTPSHHRLRDDLLASRELIALHVLGGELYRSGSNENLSSCNIQSESSSSDHPGIRTDNNNNDNVHDTITTINEDMNDT